MMKLTNLKMLSSMSALQILGANGQLKAKTSYKISKAMAKLEAAVAVFQKTRQALIDRCGERDEKGELVYADEQRTQVKLAEPVAAMKEHQDLMEAETDDLSITPISIDDLGDAMVAPAILKDLDWFVE